MSLEVSHNVKASKSKALKINLDSRYYGTFAEIGAGQEVAREFFRVGGASGTVAKAISAYDKVVSDIIYGKEDSGRYVCESRLLKMLDREYLQLHQRLRSERPKTQFFAFADTIATSSFGKKGDGNGWMGLKFEHAENAEVSQVICHLILKDPKAQLQQVMVGILGVNLLSACFYARENISIFLNDLLEDLSTESIEIDMIEVKGPAFTHFDNRLLGLEMVKRNFAQAIFFDHRGEVFRPIDKLYKKNILVLRGSFKPPTLVSQDMLKCGLSVYSKEFNLDLSQIIPLAEITMGNLQSWGDAEGSDFLLRVDLLASLGLNIMISSHERHYKLSTFFRRFTPLPIAMVLGHYNLKELLDEKNYRDLEGGMLQSFGVLVHNGDKLLIYPYQDKGGRLLTTSDLVPEVDEKYRFFYEHLRSNKLIIDLSMANHEILHIYSRRVLAMIENNEPGWEKMVPPEVASLIKARGKL